MKDLQKFIQDYKKIQSDSLDIVKQIGALTDYDNEKSKLLALNIFTLTCAFCKIDQNEFNLLKDLLDITFELNSEDIENIEKKLNINFKN